MNETNYSIDEVKLMTKVKRYKRRWKEQRHYSEYLECKLAKKATQVQELKAEAAKWRDTALQLSANCGAAGYEIDSLKTRIAELGAERDEAQKMYERLMNTAFYHETILPNGNLGVNVLEVCEGLQEAREETVRLSRWAERLVEAIESGEHIELFPKPDLIRFQDWYEKMRAIIAEWKEREKNGN